MKRLEYSVETALMFVSTQSRPIAATHTLTEEIIEEKIDPTTGEPTEVVHNSRVVATWSSAVPQ